MQSIKTVCPHCQKQYIVSVLKLRVAQGHVTCATCCHMFNAYRHMPNTHIKYRDQPVIVSPNNFQLPYHKSLEIFTVKARSSNIDLQTYLNTIQNVELDAIKPSHHPLSHLLFKEQYKPYTQSYWISIFLCICFALTLLPIIYYSVISSF